jgi:tricorn protease
MKYGKLLLSVLIAMLLSIAVYAINDARLLRSPDIYGDKIVFVYGSDLWTVSASGGIAAKLTSHPGIESNPYFSPDGKWIAFNGDYDGNRDVFIIPSEGGMPIRLTYHPSSDYVTGWSSDGKKVVFSSTRNSLNRRVSQMFEISIEGGMASQLPLPSAYLGEYNPDGKYYAYTPLPNAFTTWRRYRGGEAPHVVIFNTSDNSIKKVARKDSNDTYPQWMGDNVVFLSDRDRVMNFYSYDTKTDTIKQLTSFTGPDVKTWGTDGKQIVYEREGYLNLLDAKNGKSVKLAIKVPDEALNTRGHFVKVQDNINESDISPTGKRAVFSARGEILTVPEKKGDIRNITRTPDVMERSAVWSPDGKKIAYFSEYKGEYALFLSDQEGNQKPEIIELDENAYYKNLIWSPDSKKLMFGDSRLTLKYIDLVSKKVIKIASDTYFKGFYDYSLTAAWSPDSSWIAYSSQMDNYFHQVFLYSLKDAKSYPITDGMSDAHSPAFDRNGKYLYFAASTNLSLDVAWADMSEYPNNPTSSLYAVVLSADEPSPFKPESDDEKPAAEEKKNGKDTDKKDTKDKDKKDDKEKVKPIKVDIEGIRNRIVALPVKDVEYYSLYVGEEGKLHYLELERPDFKFKLHCFDMKERKDEMILEGINGYVISADGKKMLYSTGKNDYFIVDSGKKPKPGDGKLNTAGMEVYSEPKAEWGQMLHEAWRIHREFFYDPGMHGQDWNAIWNQYKVYIPYISHRDDLNYLIGMMIGELCVGHAYVGGGEYPDVEHVPGGLLGADYVITDGLYKIKKIYHGENWNPDLRSPLTEPGVNIKDGDYILEVNGNPVKGTDNIYSFFQKTAGKQVTIKVNSKPVLEGARTVTVVPIANEAPLRHREWIEENRKKVEEMSGGKIGYVYLPDTSVPGFNYFARYYYAHLDKKAMVVDERFNGGGYAADYIVDHLDRPLLNYWKSRYGKPQWSPTAANFGPKAMIINEWAGSGGDALPFYFKKRGIGPLIGKRTWGGLVGISGYPILMDGGFVTSPTIGYISEKGEFGIENHGVDPDIEVEITPADYIAGHDTQLEKAVQVLMDELKKNPTKEFKPGPYPRGR